MIKNAIVVMFDSLQFNYLGCYGNEWIKTPNMDRLAQEGVLFENAYTEGLPTVPCRRAMHTGRYTLPTAGWVALSSQDTTIADLCWGRPIDTALIFDCPMYRLPKFGYTRGFDKVFFTHGHEGDDYFYEGDRLFSLDPYDYFDDHTLSAYTAAVGESAANVTVAELGNYLKQMQYWTSEDDRYVARTVAQAIHYLENVDRNKQFFLWVDSFDPHEPWNPPSVYMGFPCPYDPDYEGKDEFLPIGSLTEGFYVEPQLNHIRMLYAELVTVCDTYLGKLMNAVHRLGFEENTLFFMVSDHGEPMGNGMHGHGLVRKGRPWPYEELAHVPMIMRFPGCEAGKRIKSFVQSVDVAPTVCDWLGIGIHPSMQGKSLLPLAKGEVEKVRDFAIAGYHKYSWSIITEDWSYIHWLKESVKVNLSKDFYGANIDASHIRATNDNKAVTGRTWAGTKASEEAPKDNVTRYKEAASLDGEAQWTCTPTSSVEVPDTDALYDRRNDPFQLNNVIAEHPDVARRMLEDLQLYMEDLSLS